MILSKWMKNTTLTITDLMSILRSPDVGLQNLADEIENYFCTNRSHLLDPHNNNNNII